MAEQVFKPTALLVMEHNITGLKYFCKTTLLDRVHRYKGSGIAWLKHLREHGFNVKVGLLGFYVDEKRCLDAAKKFSVDNDIVESKEWANIVEETGKIGASMKGEKNPFYGKKHKPESIESGRLKRLGRSVNKGAYRSPEQRAKISASLKGKKNPAVSAALTGRKLSDEHRKNIVEALKQRVVSDETREKIRQASLAQWARYHANGNKHA
jgi:hypothetical protein